MLPDALLTLAIPVSELEPESVVKVKESEAGSVSVVVVSEDELEPESVVYDIESDVGTMSLDELEPDTVTLVVLVMVEVSATLVVDVVGEELDKLDDAVIAPAEVPDGADVVEEDDTLDAVAGVEEEPPPTADELELEPDELELEVAGLGLPADDEVARLDDELIVTVELLVRVIVCIIVLVVVAGVEEELPVAAPVTSLLVEVGGRTPLVMRTLLELAEVGLLVETEVRVSGQIVVESGTTEVTTTEAEPESGQSVTEVAQL